LNPTIVKNKKNLKILNELISKGFYDGFIQEDRFELSRNHFPNNYLIIGSLNSRNSYNIKFGYTSTINFLLKPLLVLEFIAILFFLIKGIWLIPLIIFIVSLIIYLNFRLNRKKERNIFLDKLFSLAKKKN